MLWKFKRSVIFQESYVSLALPPSPSLRYLESEISEDDRVCKTLELEAL